MGKETKKKQPGPVTIVSREEAENLKADLPPAGPQRDDELARRLDNLQQSIEELKDVGGERERLPESAFQPIREIQHEIREHSALEVSHKDPEFDYCWVYVGRQQSQIWAKKSMVAPGMTSTWHVVQGDMPEAREFLAEDTTRRIGDTLLMRIKKDQHEILLRALEARKRLQSDGVTATLAELGQKHGRNFVVHTDPTDNLASGRPMMDTVGKRASMRSDFARQAAKARFTEMLKTGTVPGMELDVDEQTTRRRLGYT